MNQRIKTTRSGLNIRKVGYSEVGKLLRIPDAAWYISWLCVDGCEKAVNTFPKAYKGSHI